MRTVIKFDASDTIQMHLKDDLKKAIITLLLPITYIPNDIRRLYRPSMKRNTFYSIKISAAKARNLAKVFWEDPISPLTPYTLI